jgi:hypothetical protein
MLAKKKEVYSDSDTGQEKSKLKMRKEVLLSFEDVQTDAASKKCLNSLELTNNSKLKLIRTRRRIEL